MSLGSIGGLAITRARVQIPAWGLPWIDLDLAEESALSGQQSLTIADRTWSVTVVSGGSAEGHSAYRAVAGHGGWGRELAAKPYLDDAGVRLAGVLQDAAAEAGESITELPTARLGPHYARAAGDPASHLLNLHAPRNWYVRDDGVTVIGQRPAATYNGSAPRTRIDPAGQVVELACESLAGVDPGMQIDGGLPATDVEILLDSSRLVARVYSGQRRTRRMAAMARILAALDPGARYSGCYEFRVVLQQGERLYLQPARAASGMPDLSRVPVRPGVAGVKATAALGELVLVTFADRDPSRPQVIAHAAADEPGWMPLELQLGESPALGVARLTDPVVAGPFGGTIVQASARIKAGL